MNPRPSPWQGDALPLSYSRLVLTEYIGTPESGQRLRHTALQRPLWIASSIQVRRHRSFACFDASDAAVAHVDNTITDDGGFRVVRDHQRRLAKFLI